MVPPLLGTSPAIRKLRKLLPELASSDQPLLILGEPGVGKTHLARQIHSLSEYRTRPFSSLNFSTLSERDQRLEMFGAEPPEYNTTKKGILEHLTTVVIKHVDCASHYLQDRIADSLSTGRVKRFGGTHPFPVLCRPIFTLYQSLAVLRKKGRLSPSLYAALSSADTIRIPPLRAHPESISALSIQLRRDLIKGNSGKSHHGQKESLSGLLEKQQWRENVTELKAFLRSIMVHSPEESLRQHEKIELEKMIMLVQEGREFSLRQSLALIENGIIDRALGRTHGHMPRAARLLGMTSQNLHRIRGLLSLAVLSSTLGICRSSEIVFMLFG